VRSFRISQFKPHTVRIVIETVRAYHPQHGRIAPKRYAIALPKAAKVKIGSLFSSLNRSAPSAPVSRPSSVPAKAAKPTSKSVAQSPAKPASATAVAPRRTADTPPPPKAVRPTRHRYTVVIDPGHGGHDTGAVGGGKREKQLVLQIAKRVQSHLKKMGFRVLMTRSNDRFVPLRDRTRYANRKHGDVFVSIHVNSIGHPKKRSLNGIETYFLQPSRNERARRVAARENSVVLRRKDRLSQNVILNAVMTGPKIVLSNKLAIDIQRHMLGNVRRHYKHVHDGGVRSAPFWVLVGAEMPAVLVEVGYLSNRNERKRLTSSRYQELLAQGIAQGIANYLRNREREME
jgi:N-acetylmuramoyl-L-alanine amidase